MLSNSELPGFVSSSSSSMWGAVGWPVAAFGTLVARGVSSVNKLRMPVRFASGVIETCSLGGRVSWLSTVFQSSSKS